MDENRGRKKEPGEDNNEQSTLKPTTALPLKRKKERKSQKIKNLCLELLGGAFSGRSM